MKEKEIKKDSRSYRRCVRKTEKKYREMSYEEMKTLGDTVLPKKYAAAHKKEGQSDKLTTLGNVITNGCFGLLIGMFNPARMGLMLDIKYGVKGIDLREVFGDLTNLTMLAGITGSMALGMFSLYKLGQVQNMLCDNANFCKLEAERNGNPEPTAELAKYEPYINKTLKNFRMKKSMKRLQKEFMGVPASDLTYIKDKYLEQNIGKMFDATKDAKILAYKSATVGAFGYGLFYGLELLSEPFYGTIYGTPHEQDLGAYAFAVLCGAALLQPFSFIGSRRGKGATKSRKEAEAYLDVLGDKQISEASKDTLAPCVEFAR